MVAERWLQGLPARPPGSCGLLAPARALPRHRPAAHAPLDAVARAARGPSDQDRAQTASGTGESSRGVWHPRGRRAGLSGLRMAEQYSIDRADQRGDPSAGGRRGAAWRHVMQGRGWGASAACPVPLLRQLRLTAYQFAPALPTARAHHRHGFGSAVAALHAGDGGRLDGAGVELARQPTLSRAAVAAARGGVSQQGGGKRAKEGSLSRRCACAWPASRASTGGAKAAGRP